MKNIPKPYGQTFTNGIKHPELFLWDAWSYVEAQTIHLYCLALTRVQSDGTVIPPQERNDVPFHIRHFTSTDNGKTWKDEGCFLEPSLGTQRHDAKTIWSGSIEKLTDGRKLVAYTGLSVVDENHKFLQNIALAISDDGYIVQQIADEPLSSPLRDWDEIVNKGYYLDQPKNLGNKHGEEGGPILTWRDPFIFIDKEQQINLFWAAKIAPSKSAIARAILEVDEDGILFKIAKLSSPITVPDGYEFTQLELPKVLYDAASGWYYLLASTCNRLYEGQSDAEVDKRIRLYRSKDIEGPWVSVNNHLFPNKSLFGPTVLKTDFKNNRLLCISPYTDADKEGLGLTFSPIFYVYLNSGRVEFV